MTFLGKTIVCCPNHCRKTCLYVPRKGHRMLQRIQTPLFGLWHRSGTMWIRVEWWLQSVIFIVLNFKTDPFFGPHVSHNKIRKSVNILSFAPGERNGHGRDWVLHNGQQLNVAQMKVVLVAEPEQKLKSIPELELIAGGANQRIQKYNNKSTVTRSKPVEYHPVFLNCISVVVRPNLKFRKVNSMYTTVHLVR